jgi:subtilisin-like proprotein convertase family protein/Zn-dependent metalloprotease
VIALAAAALAAIATGTVVSRQALQSSARKRGATSLQQTHPVELQTSFEATPRLLSAEADFLPDAKVERDELGVVRRVRGQIASPEARNAREASSQFLQRIAPHLPAGMPELQLTREVESLGAFHLTYAQVYNNLPVYQGRVSVHTDKALHIQNVNLDMVPITRPRPLRHPQNPALAIRAAVAHIGARPAPGLTPVAEAMVFAQKETPVPVWKVNFVTHTPPADWEVIVHAETRQVLQARNLAKYVNGSGHVFDPDPVSTSGIANIPDNNNADSIQLTNQRKAVTLRDLDGSGRLQGTYCTTAPSTSITRAFSATNTFSFTRSQDGFEEAMVYYHIDTTVRYILSLGFTNIQNRQTGVNVNGITDDNSFYSPSTKRLTFGTGGVDDAEDAHIIYHEFGHAIHDNQVPGWGQTTEGGAMGEGFSDYWAAQGFAGVGPQAPAWDPYVGKWDAVSYNPGTPAFLRRVDGNKRYPNDIVNQVHADGEIWSACLWQLRALVGRDRANRIILESHFSVPPSGGFVDGANAIITANQNLYGGADRTAIRQIFVDRGILEVIAAPTNLQANALSATQVDLNWTDNAADEQGFRIERRIALGNFVEIATVGPNVTTYRDTTATPNSDHTYRVRAYNAEGNSRFSNEATIQTPPASYSITGRVSGAQGLDGIAVQATGTVSQIGTYETAPGLPIQDNTTVTSTLNVPATGILTNIRVGVNITHTYRSDLVVTVIAPDNTEVILHNRTGGSADNIITSYPNLTTPAQSLTALNGKQINGNWRLRVSDQANLDTGTLNSWSLTLTFDGPLTRTVSTNSDGDFSLNDLPAGTYTVQPTSTGLTYSPTSRSVTLNANTTGQSFAASASLAGTITLDGAANMAQTITIEARPNGGGSATRFTRTLSATGGFSIASLPAGNYTFHLDGSKWLAKNVAVNATRNVAAFSAMLAAGDITGDNIVDLFDLITFFEAYGSAPGDGSWNELADLNCDSTIIDLFDLILLFSHYGETGDP